MYLKSAELDFLNELAIGIKFAIVYGERAETLEEQYLKLLRLTDELNERKKKCNSNTWNLIKEKRKNNKNYARSNKRS